MSDQIPAPENTPETPAARKRRRWPAVAAACAVLLAVAGGTGYTVTKVDAADRTVTTTVWGKPKQQEQRAGRATGAKSDLMERLLPMPEGYVPGPDIDEFGNDKAITGPEAVARLKKGSDDLPARQRDAQQRAIDKLKLKGLAMRSYASGEFSRPYVNQDADYAVVEIQLAELENRRMGRALESFRSAFLHTFAGFSKGPKIKGHKNADCFLAPRTKDTKLDMLLCSAYEDDVLVTVTAYGTKAIDRKAVATLLGQQLDHIASRGELV
ncbi:hypothetical protein [Streptomyces sp. NPDC046939]|uniref:hypothetical protein n=1 Tax=Streptomyces sp. NPDC046939 TaxID=3155376 RepID=UPI0033FF684F